MPASAYIDVKLYICVRAKHMFLLLHVILVQHASHTCWIESSADAAVLQLAAEMTGC